jgi:hypothetical protein
MVKYCMNEPKRQLVQAWLTKARRDLTSAHVLAAQVEPLLDTAVYHCQQAGEKAVKAFLTFNDCEFERIHDVERLVHLAISYESRFGAFVSDARLLTPYARFFAIPVSQQNRPKASLHRQSWLRLTSIHSCYPCSQPKRFPKSEVVR